MAELEMTETTEPTEKREQSLLNLVCYIGAALFLALVVYMLVILMGASLIKAALIVAYFMHLRFERINLILTIVPAVVICICLFMVFFPDSFRAKNLRYSGPPPSAEGSK